MDGKLSYVEDNFGRRLDFGYDADGRLKTLTTPVGLFGYDYDELGNLIKVTHPDLTAESYLYDDPDDPHNLTGMIDENGIRAATYTYDGQDRCVISEGAGGLTRIRVS